MTDNMQN